MDDRRPSLRRVDQENLLKVRRDSKTRRPSLADVIPDWPALHKVKRPEKVKTDRSQSPYTLGNGYGSIILIIFD